MVGYVKELVKPVWERLRTYRYPALILLVGVLFLLLPGRQSQRETAAEPTPEPGEELFDIQTFTVETERMLSALPGAGEVRLLLTLESDGSREYLADQRDSRSEITGQNQREAVLVNRDGDQYPVTVSRRYPEFRGAVAICAGGDSPALVLAIKQALSSLTGLGMDQITVLKSA